MMYQGRPPFLCFEPSVGLNVNEWSSLGHEKWFSHLAAMAQKLNQTGAGYLDMAAILEATSRPEPTIRRTLQELEDVGILVKRSLEFHEYQSARRSGRRASLYTVVGTTPSTSTIPASTRTTGSLDKRSPSSEVFLRRLMGNPVIDDVFLGALSAALDWSSSTRVVDTIDTSVNWYGCQVRVVARNTDGGGVMKIGDARVVAALFGMVKERIKSSGISDQVFGFYLNDLEDSLEKGRGTNTRETVLAALRRIMGTRFLIYLSEELSSRLGLPGGEGMSDISIMLMPTIYQESSGRRRVWVSFELAKRWRDGLVGRVKNRWVSFIANPGLLTEDDDTAVALWLYLKRRLNSSGQTQVFDVVQLHQDLAPSLSWTDFASKWREMVKAKVGNAIEEMVRVEGSLIPAGGSFSLMGYIVQSKGRRVVVVSDPMDAIVGQASPASLLRRHRKEHEVVEDE